MRYIPSGRGFSVSSQMLTVVKDGLVLNVDAGDTNSYPGTGVTWSDRSTVASNFTLTNGPSFTSATSTVGSHISFDGVDDYAEDGGANALKTISNGGDFTIDLWIKFNSATITQMICGNTNSSLGGGFALTIVPSSGSALLRVNYSTSNSFYFVTTGTALSTGTWRHIVAMFDYDNGSSSSNYKVYSNNSLFHDSGALGQPSSPTSSLNSFRIARRPAGTQPGNISVGALKVYNKLLSTTEIAQNYNALRGRFGL